MKGILVILGKILDSKFQTIDWGPNYKYYVSIGLKGPMKVTNLIKH